MSDRPPTSVLLPTTRWTDACAELAAQLGDSDELLVIHDGAGDPVTEQDDHSEGVRLVAAGEPRAVRGRPTPSLPGWKPRATIASSGRTTTSTIPQSGWRR